ncbi:hypothetical protein F5Y05DRAFT_144195 [Hypoxylon sp. FL0543]|nr:hypothetical protein F5Y05DRAFT_144195 [Hypoxylon sp. FL0543]
MLHAATAVQLLVTTRSLPPLSLTHLVRYGSPRNGPELPGTPPVPPSLSLSGCIPSHALRWSPFWFSCCRLFLLLVSYASLVFGYTFFGFVGLETVQALGCELEFIWSSVARIRGFFWLCGIWALAAASKELNIIMYWGAGSTGRRLLFLLSLVSLSSFLGMGLLPRLFGAIFFLFPAPPTIFPLLQYPRKAGMAG